MLLRNESTALRASCARARSQSSRPNSGGTAIGIHCAVGGAGAVVLERLRQVDQLRQFLTGHLPLLIVDLAFVGLFLAVLFSLTRRWRWSPPPPCRSSRALDRWRSAARRRISSAAHARAAGAKATALGEAVTRR